MSHFLYFRQFAAEECEEADFTMTLIFGASENIWNMYCLTTCASKDKAIFFLISNKH
jgi:hypothetical protein